MRARPRRHRRVHRRRHLHARRRTVRRDRHPHRRRHVRGRFERRDDRHVPCRAIARAASQRAVPDRARRRRHGPEAHAEVHAEGGRRGRVCAGRHDVRARRERAGRRECRHGERHGHAEQQGRRHRSPCPVTVTFADDGASVSSTARFEVTAPAALGSSELETATVDGVNVVYAPFSADSPMTVAQLLAKVTAEPSGADKGVYRDGVRLEAGAELAENDVLRLLRERFHRVRRLRGEVEDHVGLGERLPGARAGSDLVRAASDRGRRRVVGYRRLRRDVSELDVRDLLRSGRGLREPQPAHRPLRHPWPDQRFARVRWWLRHGVEGAEGRHGEGVHPRGRAVPAPGRAATARR